jgi:PHP family Zn ribbon phosphoesterase
MRINIDLHCHSNYSPSVFNVSLEKLALAMGLKGIDIMGTGDCLFPQWLETLRNTLTEIEEGIFALQKIKRSDSKASLEEIKKAKFILQTELIFTFAKKGERGRKRMDVVCLFPSFEIAERAIELLNKWRVKNTTGRPFIICSEPTEVERKIKEIVDLDEWVEVIPAHIMTPEGIFGSHNNINSLKEVFEDASKLFHAVETGLSADGEILSLIPELDNFTFISSSDLHSASVDAVGRESTVLDIKELKYKEIIRAIRENRVLFTIEFPPSEGKYFFTGHRGDRPGHQGIPCYYSPKHSPPSGICPICKKKLNIGVLERAFQLQKIQGGKRKLGELRPEAKPFIRVIPLFEVLKAQMVGEREYIMICGEFGNELKFWEIDVKETEQKLSSLHLEPKLIETLLKVKHGEYCFNPPGYDGVFGTLRIGEKIDLLNIKVGPKSEEQLNLL